MHPSNDKHGPWCFIDIALDKLEYCSIPLCLDPDPGCKNDSYGTGYQGKLSTTWDRMICLPWIITQAPATYSLRDNDINYCRNPNNYIYGPWCYIHIGNRLQIGRPCHIPYCRNITVDKQECKETYQGFNYAGTVSQTAISINCKAWVEQTYFHDFSFPENNVTEAKS